MWTFLLDIPYKVAFAWSLFDSIIDISTWPPKFRHARKAKSLILVDAVVCIYIYYYIFQKKIIMFLYIIKIILKDVLAKFADDEVHRDQLKTKLNWAISNLSDIDVSDQFVLFG